MEPKATAAAKPTPMAKPTSSGPPGSPERVRVFRKPTPMDPISANKVWKEHCDKCDALPIIQGHFQIDPRTMFTITDKPTNFKPSIRVTMKEFEDAIKLMEKLSPIKNPEMPPPDKYELPLTTTQEYGWSSKPLINKHPLFTFERHSCELTLYAHKYYMSQGVNPFAKTKPITGQIGKAKETAAPATGKSKIGASAATTSGAPPTPNKTAAPTPAASQEPTPAPVSL